MVNDKNKKLYISNSWRTKGLAKLPTNMKPKYDVGEGESMRKQAY